MSINKNYSARSYFLDHCLGPVEIFEDVFPIIDWFTEFQIKDGLRPRSEILTRVEIDEFNAKKAELGRIVWGIVRDLTNREANVLMFTFHNRHPVDLKKADYEVARERLQACCSHPMECMNVIRQISTIIHLRPYLRRPDSWHV